MDVKIALAGNPNCGKTTLFNALTGSNQYVGNCSSPVRSGVSPESPCLQAMVPPVPRRRMCFINDNPLSSVDIPQSVSSISKKK